MKEKINTIVQSIKDFVVPKLQIFDEKITTLVPNPKIKKVLYISIGSLFVFMFLIIILGLLLSPLRNKNTPTSLILNKPNIINSTTIPQIELTEIQKEILNLETQIKELRFPESILNIPQIERNITI